MSLTPETIQTFDAALSGYLTEKFGDRWRSMCHQSAKIASFALRGLYPRISIVIRRVELIGYMEGATGFGHIGYPEDVTIDGKIPAHYAVTAGVALYDPTFWQLTQLKTPLDLPAEGYFFSDEFMLHVEQADEQGFVWTGQKRPSGLLRIGYKFHKNLYLLSVTDQFMTDEVAQTHALAVIDSLGRYAQQ